MLTLKKLEIERDWHDKTKYKGEVKFDGEAGMVSLTLTPELCNKLLLLCAEAVLTTAKEAATSLVCEAQASIAQAATTTNIGG